MTAGRRDGSDSRDEHSLRILHVEDDPLSAALVRETLARQDLVTVAELVQATTRDSGLAALTDNGPWDVVLLDLHLPDAEGIELVDSFATHTPATAIVVLTADSTSDVGVDVLRRGAAEVLAKSDLVGPALARCLRFAVERQRFHAHLRSAADTDELTRLPNRRALAAFFARGMAQADRTPMTVLLAVLDVNDFKQINDRLGHAFGDRVLMDVAHGLRTAIRAEDLAARIGGDEFVVCAVISSSDEAAALSTRLTAATQLDGDLASIPVSLALGLVEVQSGESLETALARADAAMYENKRAGSLREAISTSDLTRPAPSTSAPTVLVVEDDPFDAVLLTEALTRSGTFHVIRAESVADVAGVMSDDVAALVVDLGLPDSDGIDTVVSLRGFDRPIVVVSAADRAMRPAVIQVGAQEFVAKTEVRPASLTRVVGYAIESFEREHRLTDAIRALRAAHARLGETPDDGRDNTLSGDTTQRLARIIGSGSVDLGNPSVDVVATYAWAARALGLQRTEVQVHGRGQVTGDRLLLRHLALNLLSNTRKHAASRDRGLLVEVAVSDGPRQVEITIDDNGPGIPEADRDRMLLPATRGNAALRTTGFGLGLPASVSIAEKHGGRLRLLDSALGGTRVHVTLAKDGVGAR